MKLTGDQYYVKQMNKAIVLETIKQQYPLSRAQVSVQTGLNKATVSSLVLELIDEHMVNEMGPGHSTRGRKPVMLLFHKRAGYAIGIDIGVHYILSVLTDLEGNKMEECCTLHDNSALQATIEIIHEHIDQLKAHTTDSHYGVVGIALAIPGIIDQDGRIIFAPNLGWHNVDLTEPLQKKYNHPIMIDNEANAGALAEKEYGAAQECSSMIYVSAGIGIGVGILLNKHLYKGFAGFAGEFGHTMIQANGKKCSCGSRGCWELYASEQSLLELAQQQLDHLSKPGQPIELNQLIDSAQEEDADVIGIFQQVGHYLGLGIANLLNTFNPEAIIIGNNLARAKQWIEPPLRRAVQENALVYHQNHVRLQFSELGLYSNSLGAASMVISHFLSGHYPKNQQETWGG